MPKKTKKEKILAMYHKKLRLLENRGATISSVQIKNPVSVPSPVINNVTRPVVHEPVNQYFFSDFKKSLLLIVLILGLEVSLYFAKLIK